MGDVTSGKLSLIIDGKCSNKNLVIDNFSSLKSANKSSITFFIDRKLTTELKKTYIKKRAYWKKSNNKWKSLEDIRFYTISFKSNIQSVQ